MFVCVQVNLGQLHRGSSLSLSLQARPCVEGGCCRAVATMTIVVIVHVNDDLIHMIIHGHFVQHRPFAFAFAFA